MYACWDEVLLPALRTTAWRLPIVRRQHKRLLVQIKVTQALRARLAELGEDVDI